MSRPLTFALVLRGQLSDSLMCEPTSGAEASWVGGAKSASLIGRFKPKKHTALIGQFKLYDDRGLINVY